MNEEELQKFNVTCMCDNEANEHENTSSMHENEDKKNTLSTS